MLPDKSCHIRPYRLWGRVEQKMADTFLFRAEYERDSIVHNRAATPTRLALQAGSDADISIRFCLADGMFQLFCFHLFIFYIHEPFPASCTKANILTDKYSISSSESSLCCTTSFIISGLDTALKPFLKKAFRAVSNNNLCVYSFVVCIGQNIAPIIAYKVRYILKMKQSLKIGIVPWSNP